MKGDGASTDLDLGKRTTEEQEKTPDQIIAQDTNL